MFCYLYDFINVVRLLQHRRLEQVDELFRKVDDRRKVIN